MPHCPGKSIGSISAADIEFSIFIFINWHNSMNWTKFFFLNGHLSQRYKMVIKKYDPGWGMFLWGRYGKFLSTSLCDM